MTHVFVPGREVSFFYPRHNFHSVSSALERRRIRVEFVRDLTVEPLSEEDIERQPLLRRGRWLVTGQDLDKLAERSFYVESMRQISPV
jgi:hypothetical protein